MTKIKHISLKIEGDISEDTSDGINQVLNALDKPFTEEEKPKWHKKIWDWFKGLSLKFKLALIILIAMVSLSSFRAYQAGSIEGAKKAFEPITKVFMVIIKPIKDIISNPGENLNVIEE